MHIVPLHTPAPSAVCARAGLGMRCRVVACNPFITCPTIVLTQQGTLKYAMHQVRSLSAHSIIRELSHVEHKQGNS